MPGTRIELVQPQGPRDFKSLASTYSATRASLFIYMVIPGCVNLKSRHGVDGHRHTYHPQVYRKDEGEDGKQHEERVLGRVEAARRIRTVLSKLGQEWWRKPHKLPGWKDSL